MLSVAPYLGPLVLQHAVKKSRKLTIKVIHKKLGKKLPELSPWNEKKVHFLLPLWYKAFHKSFVVHLMNSDRKIS